MVISFYFFSRLHNYKKFSGTNSRTIHHQWREIGNLNHDLIFRDVALALQVTFNDNDLTFRNRVSYIKHNHRSQSKRWCKQHSTSKQSKYHCHFVFSTMNDANRYYHSHYRERTKCFAVVLVAFPLATASVASGRVRIIEVSHWPRSVLGAGPRALGVNSTPKEFNFKIFIGDSFVSVFVLESSWARRSLLDVLVKRVVRLYRRSAASRGCFHGFARG